MVCRDGKKKTVDMVQQEAMRPAALVRSAQAAAKALKRASGAKIMDKGSNLKLPCGTVATA